MVSWLLSAALTVSAPASAQSDVSEATMPRPEQVMALPPELRAEFQRQVLSQGGAETRRLERLVDFLFKESGLGMQYRQDATYTVERAYRTREANCLTFTLMVVALAREAGLEAYGQEIEETLSWHQQESIIYRNNHINAGIAIGGRRSTVDVAWDSVIARHPPQSVPDERLLAHFYSNRGVELLAGGQPERAMEHMRTSLRLDPGFATTWSNAGVLYLKKGDLAAAERHYLQALALNPVQGAALFNLVTLYQRTGEKARENAFQRRLENARLKDPFHQFLLAFDYEKNGDYARAVKHYRRAIRLHDGEHRFYFGLARAYLQLGKARRAGSALARAHDLSQGETRGLYQAKLNSLRQRGK